MKLNKLIVILLLAFLASCSNSDSYKLTILTTNDHHGHYWKNRHGEGGLAARMTLVNSIRDEVKKDGGHLLVLSSGDINTGIPESNLLYAEPDILGMNLIGYDAAAIGNHEFDNPQEVLRKQIKWAKFPFVASNIFDKRSGKHAFVPYVIKDFKDFKVAIMGFTVEDTPLRTVEENTKGLVFKSPIEVTKTMVPDLKKKADIVIAVTHLGYYKKGLHGDNAPGDVTLAKNTKGLSFIAGGHTHEKMKKYKKVSGTIIVQAEEWGRYVSRSDLEINKKSKKVKIKDYRLIPVNLKKKVKVGGKKVRQLVEEEIKEDPKMLALLSPFKAAVDEKLRVKIGYASERFEGKRKIIRSRETNLGNLFTYAMRELSGGHVAVANSGGIRDSIAQGAVSYRDVIKVHPFGNTICNVSLTGVELKKYLEVVLSFKPGEGSFPQTSGITATVKDGKILKLKVNGKKVKDNKKYILSINNFIGSGGDGYPDLSAHPTYIDTGFTLEQALIEYFKKHNKVSVKKFKSKKKIIVR